MSMSKVIHFVGTLETNPLSHNNDEWTTLGKSYQSTLDNNMTHSSYKVVRQRSLCDGFIQFSLIHSRKNKHRALSIIRASGHAGHRVRG